MIHQPTRTRVAIIFGGTSSEHDVSCLTAGGVSRAIDTSKFEVVGIGITPSGTWVQVPTEEMRDMEVVDQRLPRLTQDRPPAVLLPRDGGGRIASLIRDQVTDVRDFDVAFTLLHGPFGEDGTIQGMFEMLGIRYVGSGVAASAIGMDKDLMKRALAGAGLPVGPWLAISSLDWQQRRDTVLADVVELGFPVYVKPARGGSSMGISKVTNVEGLVEAIEEARRFDPKVVVEKGFVGVREIEVAVLGSTDGLPRASLPGEIRMHTPDAFYDYSAKYTPESQVSLDIPATVTDDLRQRAQQLAIRTFEAMDAEGLARVDLFATPQGELFVNELNTMPGFTRLSMYPSLWEATGISYGDLIAELISLALQRPLGLR